MNVKCHICSKPVAEIKFIGNSSITIDWAECEECLKKRDEEDAD